MDNLAKARSSVGKRYKVTNESLLLRFFRFLVIKLPQKNCQFDINKGHIKFKKYAGGKKSFVSIKDPFLKFENHGYSMRSENKFNRLIWVMKQFIIEASMGRLEDMISQTEFPEEQKEPETEDEE